MSDEAANAEDLQAEEAAPEDQQRPRVWTVLVLPVIAIPIYLFVTGVVIGLATIIYLREPNSGVVGLQEDMEEFVQTPAGIWINFVPQGVYLFLALTAATLSPVPLVERLRLRRPRLSWQTWVLWIAATPVLALLGGYVSHLIFGASETIGYFDELSRTLPFSLWLPFAISISLTPGICEEMFFRGYVQSRLLERWFPWAAIATSAILFSVAHLEPAHAVGTIPIGIWLGILAWRTGSIWPAAVCHAANNAFSSIVSRFDPNHGIMVWNVSETLLVTISGMALLVALFGIFFGQRRSGSDRRLEAA